MDNQNQRLGSTSNSQVGIDFEAKAKNYLEKRFNCAFTKNFGLKIGINNSRKKLHRFDLGCKDNNIIVECKSHTWTESGNMPSAKVTVLREAIFYFHFVRFSIYKNFICQKKYSSKKWRIISSIFCSVK